MKRHSILSLLLLVLAMLALAAPPAFARTVDLQQNVGRSALQSACAANGGDFGSDSKGYACVKENCDGKGGMCSVVCDTGKNCTGTTPGRIVASMPLIRILTDHYIGLLDDADQGTPNKGGMPLAAPAAPPAPAGVP